MEDGVKTEVGITEMLENLRWHNERVKQTSKRLEQVFEEMLSQGLAVGQIVAVTERGPAFGAKVTIGRRFGFTFRITEPISVGVDYRSPEYSTWRARAISVCPNTFRSLGNPLTLVGDVFPAMTLLIGPEETHTEYIVRKVQEHRDKVISQEPAPV